MSTKSGLRRALAPLVTASRATIALALLAVLASACGSSSQVSTPTPPPPLVSPAAAGVAVDLERADALYRDGDWPGALEIYSAAVLRGSSEEKQQAIWRVARIQYELGDNAAAAQNARAFLGGTVPPEEEARAQLLLGFSEAAQGHAEAAEEALERYVESGGPASSRAQMQLAEIASSSGDPRGAITLVNRALATPLGEDAQTEGMFSLARYQEEAGARPAAIATYRRLANEGATQSDRAEALWLLAAAAREEQDAATEQAALADLIVRYPWHERALEALNQATGVGAPERAYTLFRHRQNEEATVAYQSLSETADAVMAGEAHYYLGILAERAGDPGQALNAYGGAIERLRGTASPLLGDAYWDRGLVFEAAERLEEAAEHYASVAAVLPGHDRAAEGLFRAGMVRYRQGLYADAAALWASLGAAGGGEDAARGHFWRAMAMAALGDFSSQAQDLEAAAAAAPFSYYGLRSPALLAGEPPASEAGTLAAGTPDWASIETWLLSAFGPEDTAATAAFFTDTGWQQGNELLETGLLEPAAEEIGPLVDAATSPWVRYRAARSLHEHGQVRLAARAAGPILSSVTQPPPAAFRLVYPVRFTSPLNAAAAEHGVSPFLLAGLVRQESFFDDRALSSAGALGLTQVMPATGADIAAALGEDDYKEGDLLKADTGLRFGAYYLSTQIDGFGGNPAAALAAYNGGPGNAGRWAEAAGGDPDLLLESIDFDETRLYVEVVLGNYALYRYAYGATDHLSLPMP